MDGKGKKDVIKYLFYMLYKLIFCNCFASENLSNEA